MTEIPLAGGLGLEGYYVGDGPQASVFLPHRWKIEQSRLAGQFQHTVGARPHRRFDGLIDIFWLIFARNRLTTREVLMTKFVITIAALATISTAAHAQTTVDQWIALCSKGPSTIEHASCEFYACGVADAVLSFQATRPQLSTSCIPAHVTAKDLVTLALPYAQGQPQATRQLLGATLLIDVFREAFPCPQK
jgi:hypothetical protein